MSSPRRSIVCRTVVLLAIVPLLLSGCASGESSGDASARKVVTQFFGLLESGHLGGISALLAADSDLTAQALSSKFYAAAVARPTDATVGAIYEDKPATFYASVDYLIKGKKRNLDVVLVESGGQPKISTWEDGAGLLVDVSGGPGGFEVNGSYRMKPDKSGLSTFAPLPGVYRFRYVDPQGFGTVDPKGAPTRPFDIELPGDPTRALANLPPGVSSTAGTDISAHPRLLATVEKSVQAQLASLITKCTASRLVGASCPQDLGSVERRGTTVDESTVVWTHTKSQLGPPANQWGFYSEYSVTFKRFDSGVTETADATFDMVVLQDADGKPVLSTAVRPDF